MTTNRGQTPVDNSKRGLTPRDPMREVKVWDIAVRVGHWSLVVLFAVAYLSGEIEVETLHQRPADRPLRSDRKRAGGGKRHGTRLRLTRL